MTNTIRFTLLTLGLAALGCGGGSQQAPEIAPAPLVRVDRTCGGHRAPDSGGGGCSENEYCHYTPDAICGRADATGTCRVKPRICTRELRPVCGCDGQTYPTACVASSQGVSVDHEGECAPPVAAEPPVPEGVGNVCGTRGAEPCPEGLFCDFSLEAHCGAADVPGTCQVKPEACTQDVAEVCGCDTTTYSNACAAHLAGVAVATEGACPPPPPARPTRRRAAPRPR